MRLRTERIENKKNKRWFFGKKSIKIDNLLTNEGEKAQITKIMN